MRGMEVMVCRREGEERARQTEKYEEQLQTKFQER